MTVENEPIFSIHNRSPNESEEINLHKFTHSETISITCPKRNVDKIESNSKNCSQQMTIESISEEFNSLKCLHGNRTSHTDPESDSNINGDQLIIVDHPVNQACSVISDTRYKDIGDQLVIVDHASQNQRLNPSANSRNIISFSRETNCKSTESNSQNSPRSQSFVMSANTKSTESNSIMITR